MKADIDHPSLADLIEPIGSLFDDVRRKALMRLEYEGLHKTEAITAVGNRYIPCVDRYIPCVDRYIPCVDRYIPCVDRYIPCVDRYIPCVDRYIPCVDRYIPCVGGD